MQLSDKHEFNKVSSQISITPENEQPKHEALEGMAEERNSLTKSLSLFGCQILCGDSFSVTSFCPAGTQGPHLEALPCC